MIEEAPRPVRRQYDVRVPKGCQVILKIFNPVDHLHLTPKSPRAMVNPWTLYFSIFTAGIPRTIECTLQKSGGYPGSFAKLGEYAYIHK